MLRRGRYHCHNIEQGCLVAIKLARAGVELAHPAIWAICYLCYSAAGAAASLHFSRVAPRVCDISATFSVPWLLKSFSTFRTLSTSSFLNTIGFISFLQLPFKKDCTAGQKGYALTKSKQCFASEFSLKMIAPFQLS